MTWRVPKEKYQRVSRDQCLSRDVDFLGVELKLQIYPKPVGCNRPVLFVQNVAAQSQVRRTDLSCTMSWNGWFFKHSSNIQADERHEYHSETHDQMFEIVIEYLCLNGEGVKGVVLARFLKSELDRERSSKQDAEVSARHLAIQLRKEKDCRQEPEAHAKRLGVELQNEKTCATKSAAQAERLGAEVDYFRTLIHAGSTEAAERVTCSAVKIQAKWRQVSTGRRLLRKRAEKVWLEQQKKVEAETPYDAILVALLPRSSVFLKSLCGCVLCFFFTLRLLLFSSFSLPSPAPPLRTPGILLTSIKLSCIK